MRNGSGKLAESDMETLESAASASRSSPPSFVMTLEALAEAAVLLSLPLQVGGRRRTKQRKQEG